MKRPASYSSAYAARKIRHGNSEAVPKLLSDPWIDAPYGCPEAFLFLKASISLDINDAADYSHNDLKIVHHIMQALFAVGDLNAFKHLSGHDLIYTDILIYVLNQILFADRLAFAPDIVHVEINIDIIQHRNIGQRLECVYIVHIIGVLREL